MEGIKLKNITKKFGSTIAVDNLNLSIKSKEFITLLGPSGCGKTTILRMISGLESPTEGEIYINDKLVFSSEKGIDLSPVKRGIGFVFQNYALWPHMNVFENIVFGLENAKWKKEDINKRAYELAEMLQIDQYFERYPSELSGGQQQRVAIARTLAPNPSVLFMDEPLSNLDAKLRLEMRSELKKIHQETNTTFIYVTHDQLEAMTLSTQICMFNKGILQQYDPPFTVYRKPSNTFVADFVGSPPMNLLEVLCENSNEEYLIISYKGLKFKFTINFKPANLETLDRSLILGVRPEYISLSNDSEIEGEIYSSLPTGLETIHNIKFNGDILTSVSFGDETYSFGDTIFFHFNSSNNLIFHPETKRLLAAGSLEVIPD